MRSLLVYSKGGPEVHDGMTHGLGVRSSHTAYGLFFPPNLLPLRRQIGLLTLSYSALLSIITLRSVCRVTVVL